ncbi:MAG TPA: CHASE2 domain-containing protein, partial [Desulfobulbus sp.]|nr:CHASE2 domain-containing protein [Desulfobulbus sp.]
MKNEPVIYRGRPVFFSLFLLAVCLLLTSSQALRRWDFTLYDLFSRVLQRPAAEDIILVAIDEHSLAVEGRWPWPRRLHAEL